MALSVGTVTADITGDPSGFNRAIDGVRASGQKFARQMGRRMQRVGSSMTRSLTLPLAAAGAAIFKLGGDFEAEMSKITGLVGVSEDQVNEWRGSIRDMAADVGRGPGELAEAMFFVTSAGFRGAEAMDVLDKSARAASAGLGETKQIADLVTSSINAYGIENLSAADATDTLTAAVREGKLEAESLAPVIGAILPIASNLAIEFDEVAGFMAAMSRTGLDAARGATALRSVMNALVKPTAQAESQLEEVGLSVAELREQAGEQGIIPVLMSLRDAFGDNQAAMANVFPNVRALTGVLNVLGQDADTVNGIMEGVADSTGSTDRAFQAAADTGKFELNAMLAEAQSLAGDLYDSMIQTLAPAFRSIQQIIRGFRNTWQGFSEEARQAVFAVAGLLGAAGPIMVAIGTLSLAIGAISAPIAGVVAAFAAGATAIISNWDDVTSFFTEGQGARMWTTFQEIIDETITAISGIWNQFGDDVVDTAETSFGLAIDIIEQSLDSILTIMEKFNGEFDTELNVFEDSILTTFQKVDAIIVNQFRSSMEGLLSILSGISSGIYDQFLEPLVDALSTAEQEARSSMGGMADVFNDSADSFLNFIGVADAGPWTDVLGQISQSANDMNDAVSDASGGTTASFIDAEGIRSASVATMSLGSSLEYTSGQLGRASSEFDTVQEAMQTTQERAVVMGQALQSTVSDAITGFATTLGNAFTGDAGAKGFFNNILTVVADFGNQLGKMLIAAGVAAQAFQSLITNPIGAIIAGGALVAASTAVRNLLEEGPSTSVNDALIRSDGSIVKFHPNDDILAMQDFGDLSPRGGSSGNISEGMLQRSFEKALGNTVTEVSPSRVFELNEQGRRGY